MTLADMSMSYDGCLHNHLNGVIDIYSLAIDGCIIHSLSVYI